MTNSEPISLYVLREKFPEQEFEAHADKDCTHPEDRRFMSGWNQICGRCGRGRSIG